MIWRYELKKEKKKRDRKNGKEYSLNFLYLIDLLETVFVVSLGQRFIFISNDILCVVNDISLFYLIHIHSNGTVSRIAEFVKLNYFETS